MYLFWLPDFLVKQNQADPKAQPIQYWPRPNHNKGVIDLLSVVRSNNALIENTRKFLGDTRRRRARTRGFAADVDDGRAF